MKKIIKKCEGGAKKHGGIGNAMIAQMHVWTEQEEQRKAEESRAQAIAEERAAAAEALAKAALEKNEKLKAELRETQAKLAIEQAAREEQELLEQLKQMQLAKAPEEEKSPLISIASKESGEGPVLSLSMEELAKQIAAKAIDVSAIILTQGNFDLLERVCIEQFSVPRGEAQVLLEGLDDSLNIIESNVIGDVCL